MKGGEIEECSAAAQRFVPIGSAPEQNGELAPRAPAHEENPPIH